MGLPGVGASQGDLETLATGCGGSPTQLGPPDQWPGRQRRVGVFPPWLAQGVERALLEFLYYLHDMYLAVVADRMAAGCGDQEGHRDSLFPDQPRPQPRYPFPWDDLSAPCRWMRSGTSRAFG